MWMVDPKVLCQKHLCGEHVELHMFVGTLRKKISVAGYIKNNLLQPRYIFQRHEELATEMVRREMNHKSEMRETDPDIFHLPIEFQYWEINKDSAMNDLLSRCPECRKRLGELRNE